MAAPDGYVLLSQAVFVSRTDVHVAREWVGEHGKAIFNGADHGQRLQAFLPPALLERVRRQVVASVQHLLTPGVHSCTEWVVLLSKKNCQRQPQHTDYPKKTINTLPPTHRPQALMVALEDGTRLGVANGEDLQLNRGDVLLFDATFVHAGAAYPDAENVRLHAYVDSTAWQRRPNTTYPSK